ncbi:MAG: hypothetical protein HYU47_06205, partial [Deltaproteobacteria bacterium]|nr:hypothetical protein [Deltaproteobacteria bacterium]
MGAVYVAGVGMTKFGRSPQTLTELCCEAASRALSDSSIQEVEALYLGVMNPEEFTGDSNIASRIAEALGLTGLPALRIETAGATMPALAAMITERYRKRYRLSPARLERLLCRVAMKNHLNGARNPCAQFQQAITEQNYFSSKFVSTPLRLYDCSPITDGAAAAILTSEKTDVSVSGVGQGTGPVSLRERDSFTSFRATQMAAARAYRMAGISPKEIDFAEVHDAFTSFEIISTEDLGFFPAGRGGDAVEEGKTAVDGPLPVNPSGGLKSRGHPVGASGVAQLVEVVRGLRGSAGVKLKREAKRALAQSTGGLGTNNFVTIVERTDSPLIKNLPLPPSPAPGRKRPSIKRSQPPALSEEGRIETFTILYVTPDGFLPPLALALIRDRQGSLFMAQGEDV